jgi:glycosyltransferase involved in cell wall biosynthesis
MGVAQDMQNVLRLATSLRDLPAQFILVGRGEAVPEIQRTVRELALHNVDLHDAVSESEYMELLAKCDVGLVTLDRRLKTRNVPGKLLSYLKSGKPVLASLNPDNDLAQILRDSGAGFVSINGENDRFSEHAITLIKDPGLRERMGRNALQLLEATFSVERAAAQILRLTAMDTA